VSGRALVTGGAGFIGSHLVDRLLGEGWYVTVIDNFDPFYEPGIKYANIAAHREHSSYSLLSADLRDADALSRSLTGEYDVVVHLAAKAGVRPSIASPLEYQDVNVRGTHNLLELCRRWRTPQFVFASSSSVYGVNPNVPWSESDTGLRPISPYASTKVSGELLGHVYSTLFGIRFVGLRFFTVYGPRQRPDLAIHKFARLLLRRDPLPFYGNGESRRDYTYVADIVAGIRAAMDYNTSPYEIINLGNCRTVSLTDLVNSLEGVLGVSARLKHLPDQPGDVPQTWANIEKASRLLGYAPETDLNAGLSRFAEWMCNSPRVLNAPELATALA
jgi:UDP-glucuronate 4-epimerase